MKKKLIAVSLVSVLALTSLLACSSNKTQETTSSKSSSASTASEKKEMTKVVLNEVAHSIFYAPMYVAIEEGYFVEEGIEVDLVTGFGADEIEQKVSSAVSSKL